MSKSSQDAFWKGLMGSQEDQGVPSSQELDEEREVEPDTRLSKNPSLLAQGFMHMTQIMSTAGASSESHGPPRASMKKRLLPEEEEALQREQEEAEEEELARALSFEMVKVEISRSQSQQSGQDDDAGDEDDEEDSDGDRGSDARGKESVSVGWKDDARDADFVDENEARKPARRRGGREKKKAGRAPPPPLLAIQASFVPEAPSMVGSNTASVGVREEKEASAALDELFRAASDDFHRPGLAGSLQAGGQPPLRRADLPPVCDRCRRLHRKCDRLMPCSECRMRNSNCTTGGSRRATEGGKPSTKNRKPGPKPGFKARQRERELDERQRYDDADDDDQQQADDFLGSMPKKKRMEPPAPVPVRGQDQQQQQQSSSVGTPLMRSDGFASPNARSPPVLVASVAMQPILDPDVLLPDPRHSVSLSDATVAFLPRGSGSLDMCDSCWEASLDCDRRNPCNECILAGKQMQCIRKGSRKRK